MGSATLSLKDLEVSYGDTLVLKRISLAVAAGEFVALLGPSGCGKTPLLRGLSRLVRGPRHYARAARQARHGDGVPVLRAVAAHDDRAEPRLRAQAAQGGKTGN